MYGRGFAAFGRMADCELSGKKFIHRVFSIIFEKPYGCIIYFISIFL